jgi:cytochrome P450
MTLEPRLPHSQKPPGPDVHFLRLLRAAMKDPLRFFMEMTQYGDLVTLREGRTYFVNHPDGIKHVLQDNHFNYRKGERYLQAAETLFGRGLVTSEGEFWRHQRRLIQPAFHKHHHHAYVESMATTVSGHLPTWERHAQSGEQLELRQEMTDLTLAILLRAIFGGTSSKATTAVGQAFLTLHEDLNVIAVFNPVRMPRWVPTPRRRRAAHARETIDRFIMQMVEARQAGSVSTQGDFLSLLLAARDDETGEGMPPAQLRDEILTMLGAGHDAVSQALTWTLYLIAQYPDVEQRVCAEIACVLAGREPSVDDLENLPFLSCVVQESLRLLPPVWGLMRTAIAPDVILGYPIPAGAVVVLSAYCIHRSPAVWPEPHRFSPDRFAASRSVPRHRFAYFPFGGGPRQCIGGAFAMLEVPLVVAMLLRRYRIRLVPRQDIHPVARLSLRPSGPVWITLEQRVGAAA